MNVGGGGHTCQRPCHDKPSMSGENWVPVNWLRLRKSPVDIQCFVKITYCFEEFLEYIPQFSKQNRKITTSNGLDFEVTRFWTNYAQKSPHTLEALDEVLPNQVNSYTVSSIYCHMRNCVTYPILRCMLGYANDQQLCFKCHLVTLGVLSALTNILAWVCSVMLWGVCPCYAMVYNFIQMYTNDTWQSYAQK